MIGIYAIRNLHTGKVYVGASVDVERRLTHHMRQLERGKHQVAPLQADWAVAGGEAFAFEMLEAVDGLAALREREQHHIASQRERGETYNGERPALYSTPRRREPPTEHEYLTIAEVAERLRVTGEAVRRWLRSGKLKGVRIGSTKAGWRIPESEVRRMLGGVGDAR